MRNFKKALALVLALVMVVGTFATVSAASTAWYDEAAAMLDSTGISKIGSTQDEALTRNEFVLWIAKIETNQPSDSAWMEKIESVAFSDVNEAHNQAAIAYAWKAGFIEGNGDGTFAPDKQISIAEAAAIIVRLMRYEDKVIGLESEWDMNYMGAASKYCYAFDQTFYSNTDTFNPSYALTKGEGAYLLCTIMNFFYPNGGNTHVPGNGKITDADGLDLGANFQASAGNMMVREELYIVTDMDRASSDAKSAYTFVNADGTLSVISPAKAYKNDTIGSEFVTLVSLDGKRVVRIEADEFVRALRVSMGLTADPDYFNNEEKQINPFTYVNEGSVISLKTIETFSDTVTVTNGLVAANAKEATVYDYAKITNFAVDTNTVIIDTYLRDNKLGTVDAANATSWKVLEYGKQITVADDADTKGKNEEVSVQVPISAALTFKGVTYEYNYYEGWFNAQDDAADKWIAGPATFAASKSDIVIYDETWTPMYLEEAMHKLLNVAQGETYAVMHDTDADGKIDSIYVLDGQPFYYASEKNTASDDTTATLYNSVSNGKEAATSGAAGTFGTVLVDYAVKSRGDDKTIAYAIESKDNSAIQLVLVGSGVYGNDQGAATNVQPYYTVVDLATKQTGIIEYVSVNADNKYYSATIRLADDTRVQVKIPQTASGQVTLPVTIADVTANYKFNIDADWLPFLDEADDATEIGTANDKAAWMAGKYVEFATDASNNVVYISGTTKTSTVGFITGVTEVEAGSNSYNVTLVTYEAVSGDVTYTYANGNNVIVDTDKKLFGTPALLNDGTKDAPEYVVWEAGSFDYLFTTIGSNKVTKTETKTEAAAANTDGLKEIVTTTTTGTRVHLALQVDKGVLTTEGVVDAAKVEAYFNALTEFKYYVLTQDYTAVTTENKFEVAAANTTATDVTVGTTEVSRKDFKEGDADVKYFVDIEGNRIPVAKTFATEYQAAKFVTKTVRASASGAFDYNNKAIYNEIFVKGRLIDTDRVEGETVVGDVLEGQIDATNDLIFVKVMEDAGTNYVLYANGTAAVADAIGIPASESYVVAATASGAYKFNGTIATNMLQTVAYTVSEDWTKMEDDHFVTNSKEVNPADRKYIDANGYPTDLANSVGYTTKYHVVIGYKPYYNRVYNATKNQYEYELYFEKVVTSDELVGIVKYEVDTTKTIMYALTVGYGDSEVPLIVKTDDEKKPYLDDLKYYIGSNGQVYAIHDQTKITYKKDKDGNFIGKAPDYQFEAFGALTTGKTEYFNVAFANNKMNAAGDEYLNLLGLEQKDSKTAPAALAIYKNFKATEAAKSTTNWFPGLYNLEIDGETYKANANTRLIVITPDKTAGFTITNTTLAKVLDKDLFITNWEANVLAGDTDTMINTITVIGDTVKDEQIEEDTPTDPNAGYTLVRLNSKAKVFIRFNETTRLWTVVSDKEAYKLPSGESIGVIQKEYTTYTDAEQAKVDFDIVGGGIYYVDTTDGKNLVKAEATDVTKSGTATITGAEYSGKVTAKLDGKTVDLSTYTTQFIMEIDGAYAQVADKQIATFKTQAEYDALDDKAQKAYDDAKAKYEAKLAEYNAGELSAEKLAYYENEMNTAKEALSTLKADNLEAYRNGKFWGVANNAIYKYFSRQSATGGNKTITFNYVLVGDVLCVFVNSFAN